MKESKYQQRGASSAKEDVHEAVKNLKKGLFEDTFCKILPDLNGDKDFCTLMHADGAGTKSALAYIYWRETGDLSVWRGIAQDAVVMNTDDIACSGAVVNISITSTIGRNKTRIPGEIIREIIEGTEEFLEKLRRTGINIHFAGGETADVGDLVRTVVVDANAFCRFPIKEVIRVNPLPGDIILGVSSSGQTLLENEYNSGIGSNGLTLARHGVLNRVYARKYPESYDENMPPELVYSGKFRLEDVIENLSVNVGKLLLSPTRTYLPLISEILKTCDRNRIRGMIHLTGGAHTKILNFIHNRHIIKDNLFPLPPVFRLIQDSSETSWEEMYRVFNMGHRLEIITDEDLAQQIILLGEKLKYETRIIGHIEDYPGKKLSIRSEFGEFNY